MTKLPCLSPDRRSHVMVSTSVDPRCTVKLASSPRLSSFLGRLRPFKSQPANNGSSIKLSIWTMKTEVGVGIENEALRMQRRREMDMAT
nr:hypothetical protein Itr_chr13CG02390 [Ipomoea trifida]